MKLNWSFGVSIGILLFIIFISTLVVRISTNKSYNYDLVTEDYYKKALEFNQEYDAKNNAKIHSNKIKIRRSKTHLIIDFSELNENIEGNLIFYRPSDKHLDFQIPILLAKNQMQIENSRLKRGKWIVNVYWKNNDKVYLNQQELNF